MDIIERNSLRPKTIGEIGCGAGAILDQLSRQYAHDVRYFGYEISPQAYELCARKSKANLAFKLADLLADDTAHFDIVMAMDVFEHVEDYPGFLRKLKEKADYKLFHIPLDLSVLTVLLPSLLREKREKVGHIHYFTKDTALASLEDAGHEVIDHFYTGSSIDLPGRSRTAKLLRIPRMLGYAINRDLTVRILGGYSLMVLTR